MLQINVLTLFFHLVFIAIPFFVHVETINYLLGKRTGGREGLWGSRASFRENNGRKMGVDETRSGCVPYVQGSQPNVPAHTTFKNIY